MAILDVSHISKAFGNTEVLRDISFSLDPGQAISPLEGLKAMTRTAAYQYHEENRKGSLAPGMLADLVILSDNPLTVPAEELRRLEVLATLKEDVPVYQREKDLFFSS